MNTQVTMATTQPGTPITADEILKYRSMVKSAIVLIVMWRLRRETGAVELSQILDIHRETVAGYLQSLAMIGLITRIDVKKGYRLTDDGQQLMLQIPEGYLLDETHINAFGNQPHALTLHSSKSAPATSELGAKVIDAGEGMSEIPTLPAVSGSGKVDMSEKPTLNVGKTDIEPLKKEEDLKSFKKITSSSLHGSNVGKTDIWKLIEISKLLEETDMLFGGDAVVIHGLDLKHISRQAVLGWLAQAYTEKRNLNSPAALVYTRLKACELPQKKYLQDPLRWLPSAYLRTVGLLKDPEPEEEPEEQAEQPDDGNAQAPDPVLDARTNEGRNMTPRQAWEGVLNQLRMEMPRASFDTWVRDTQVIGWVDGVLTVSAKNDYARDWIESRLLSTVSRLLVGILDCSELTVVFVTMEVKS